MRTTVGSLVRPEFLRRVELRDLPRVEHHDAVAVDDGV